MRAITQRSLGGPSVLESVELERPEPTVTEVLVRVHAASVNPVDTYVRAGMMPLLGQPPFVLGWDVSGVVEAVTPGVNRFRVGDEVYGMPAFPRAAGAYAEYVTAPARQLSRKPAGLSHAEAAALPLAGLTAWQGLVDGAGLQAGQRVLVHGAGGGVGHLAVQIAKARGAEVYATAGADKHDFLPELGADHLIDHRTADFTAGLTDLDVVLDPIGGDVADRSLTVLREGGALVTLVQSSDREFAERVAAAGLRFVPTVVEPDHVGLEALTELVEAGLLRPHVEQELPLAEAAKAHELIEGRRTKGKIVLTV
ncbi:NADP-dependent oxidoreductase [Kitasatospora cinereorecta]|uniref:NADP-dependent oxidoreductase n=1 Tax=Kitasatospora cinereorecta TaxID=285560 RepID=UPI0031F89583